MAAVNPLVAQGNLNLTAASVSIPSFTQLNVTAPNLGRSGIRLALAGGANRRIGTMTGVVNSPEVYMEGTVTIHLLKTQPLSDAWKAQMEFNVLLGQVTVRPDVSAGAGLSPYVFNNCSIQDISPLNFSGADPDWILEIGGFYVTNNALWLG